MKPGDLIPLGEAIKRFASKRAWESLEPPAEFDSGGLPQDPEAAVKFLPLALSALMAELSRPYQNQLRLFENICEQVTRGRLVAWGFRTKPTIGLQPEPIPAALFRNPKWDSKNDAIEAAGQRFELIQIGRADRRATRKPFDRRSNRKRMGRPSKDAEIGEIVACLLDTPDSPRHRRRMCDQVREIAKESGRDVKRGYSDSVIQRVIVRLEAERAKSKVP